MHAAVNAAAYPLSMNESLARTRTTAPSMYLGSIMENAMSHKALIRILLYLCTSYSRSLSLVVGEFHTQCMWSTALHWAEYRTALRGELHIISVKRSSNQEN